MAAVLIVAAGCFADGDGGGVRPDGEREVRVADHGERHESDVEGALSL